MASNFAKIVESPQNGTKGSNQLQSLLQQTMFNKDDVGCHVRYIQCLLDNKKPSEALIAISQHHQLVNFSSSFEWLNLAERVFEHLPTPEAQRHIVLHLCILNSLLCHSVCSKSIREVSLMLYTMDELICSATLECPKEIVQEYTAWLHLHLATFVSRFVTEDENAWTGSLKSSDVIFHCLFYCVSVAPNMENNKVQTSNTTGSASQLLSVDQIIFQEILPKQSAWRASQAGHWLLSLHQCTEMSILLNTYSSSQISQAISDFLARTKSSPRSLLVRSTPDKTVFTGEGISHELPENFVQMVYNWDSVVCTSKMATDLNVLAWILREYEEVDSSIDWLLNSSGLELLNKIVSQHFSDLQQTIDDANQSVSNTLLDSICRFDVLIFLVASISHSRWKLIETGSNFSFMPYGIFIGPLNQTCRPTPQQRNWWKTLWELTSQSGSVQNRNLLRPGLSQIRLQETVPRQAIPIIVTVARVLEFFQQSLSSGRPLRGLTHDVNLVTTRAEMYWGKAIEMIQLARQKSDKNGSFPRTSTGFWQSRQMMTTPRFQSNAAGYLFMLEGISHDSMLTKWFEEAILFKSDSLATSNIQNAINMLENCGLDSTRIHYMLGKYILQKSAGPDLSSSEKIGLCQLAESKFLLSKEKNNKESHSEEMRTSINDSLEECRQKISMILGTNIDSNSTPVQSKTVVETWPEKTSRNNPSKQTAAFETKQQAVSDSSMQSSQSTVTMERTSQILEKTVNQLIDYNRHLMDRNMDLCMRMEKLESGQQEIITQLKDIFRYMKDQQSHSESKPPENRNAPYLPPANDFISGVQLASLYPQLNPQLMNMVATLAATNMQQLNPGFVPPVLQIPQQTGIPFGVTQPRMNITQLDSATPPPSLFNPLPQTGSSLESRPVPAAQELNKPPTSVIPPPKVTQEEKLPSLVNVFGASLQQTSNVKSQIPKDNLMDKFKVIPGSWTCSVCSLVVDPNKKACPACQNPKLSDVKQNVSVKSVQKIVEEPAPTFLDKFKPQPGSWSCSGCYLNVDASRVSCPACDTPKPGHQKESSSISAAPKFQLGITESKPASAPAFNFTSPSKAAAVPIFPQFPQSSYPPVTSYSGAIQKMSENVSLSCTVTFPTFTSSNGSQFIMNKDPNVQSIFSKTIEATTTTSMFSMNITKPTFTFGATVPTTSSSTPAKPSLFGDFKFQSTGAGFGFSTQPISTNANVFPTSQQAEENAENSEDSALHDDDGDHIYFKPVLEKLPEKIEVVTGEENDEVLFCERAKLFRWFVPSNGGSGEWKERGLGPMKLLRDRETSKVRALMRRDQIHKVCLNHCVTAGMQLKPMPGAAAGKSWTWFALDCAESTEQPEKTTFCIRFKDAEQADRFGIEFNKAVQQRSPVKPTEATVKSQNPLEIGEKNDDVVLVSVEVPFVTEEQKERARKLMLRETHFSYENVPGYTPSDEDSDEKSAINTKSLTTKTEKDQLQKSKTEESQNLPIFGSFSLNANKPLLNFSDLANKTAIGFGQDSQQKPFSWHGAGSQLFSATTPKVEDDGGADEDDSGANYDPHYEPIISLPNLVERKTGEEDEEILFVMRAKLYRFHNQQWKERGLGNMKILKKVSDDSVCTARLLMRRDQVHKICCNHSITVDCPKFTTSMNAKNAICWVASDFSEGSATMEQFCIKFKEESDLNKFVETVKNVQEQLS